MLKIKNIIDKELSTPRNTTSAVQPEGGTKTKVAEVDIRGTGDNFCVEIYQFLSAFAEDHGRKPMDECEVRTLRSSKSEGGCFGGFRRRDERYHGREPVEASLTLIILFLK